MKPNYLFLSLAIGLLLFSCKKNDGKISISDTYSLNITVSPDNSGSVTTSPSKDEYESGDLVTLTAVPEVGFEFKGWEGDTISSKSTIQIIMSKNYNLTAVFETAGENNEDSVALNYTINPVNSGTITTDVTPGSNGKYKLGTIVTLTAIPSQDFAFTNWSGDTTSNESAMIITLTKNFNVVANFEAVNASQFTVAAGISTASVDGQKGGVVSVSPAQSEYDAGSSVTITATANAGYVFDHWEGSDEQSGVIHLTVDENVDVKAVFKYNNSPNFTLDANGVTIHCGAASEGEEGFVNGVKYTKRNAGSITAENASTACTTGITDMSSLFEGQSTFNEDISSWDVSNVTTLYRTFFGASQFNADISNWNVSNVKDFSGIFNGASSFNQNIGNWDLSSATLTPSMFQNAASFNQDISKWNVSNDTHMGHMFHGATSFNQNIDNWDVRKVSNMNSMFQDAKNFNQNIGGWQLEKILQMNSMFNGASSFNQDLSQWNVSTVSSTNHNNFNVGSALSEDNLPHFN